MKRIAGYIQEGAQAFILREVKTIAYFTVALSVLLYLMLGWEIGVDFAFGAILSVAAMIIGMKAAVKANVRTVEAARSSADKSLKMAFRGGALDNTKKYIESGEMGGKGTKAHEAAVTGDVFGDPLKDTAGPSLHILIKLLNIVSITLLPVLIALKL